MEPLLQVTLVVSELRRCDNCSYASGEFFSGFRYEETQAPNVCTADRRAAKLK
jgi:hypothetical protein